MDHFEGGKTSGTPKNQGNKKPFISFCNPHLPPLSSPHHLIPAMRPSACCAFDKDQAQIDGVRYASGLGFSTYHEHATGQRDPDCARLPPGRGGMLKSLR